MSINSRKAKPPPCAIGRLILAKLDQKGWFAADLADVLGCNHSYVSSVILGRKGVAVDSARALGAALGLDAATILATQDAETLRKLPEDKERFDAIRARAASVDQRNATPK